MSKQADLIDLAEKYRDEIEENYAAAQRVYFDVSRKRYNDTVEYFSFIRDGE